MTAVQVKEWRHQVMFDRVAERESLQPIALSPRPRGVTDVLSAQCRLSPDLADRWGPEGLVAGARGPLFTRRLMVGDWVPLWGER